MKKRGLKKSPEPPARRASRLSGSGDRVRVAVVVVPPVEELDLVGPVQVLSAANRLMRKPGYSVEVVTNQNTLKVEGEGGLLSFQAQSHYRSIKGKVDSLLLVCGVASRNAHDPTLFAWLRSMASTVG